MYSPLVWASFIAAILVLLALDLGVFHRKSHKVEFREAVTWSVIWVSLALAFNFGLYVCQGPKPALEFFTGYLVE
ncbi:MAG: hypothetical protein KY468_20490 [Armatimonadetes bacterium]|nr:hypothetical protein [Armatimonadota bacterium]